MGNSFFNEYPYTDFHELNLSWVIRELRSFATTLEQFVSINALKYADPIQWNITSQYEKNTIVIDPQTGVAYISVAAVPAGVALTNTDYWTEVFDLGRFVVRAAQNFTTRYEADTTTTATFNTPAGAWLTWGDTLYRANVNITAGDSYVEGGNITHITMEEITGHLADLTTTDKTNLVAAINEVLTTLSNTSGDLNDLTTTDKTNLVAAINEVLTTLSNTSGDLNDLTTTDKTNLVAAINEINTKIDGVDVQIDNVAELIQTNIELGKYVQTLGYYIPGDNGGAVYYVDSSTAGLGDITLNNGNIAHLQIFDQIYNVKQFGAHGDGVTSDSTILNNVIDEATTTAFSTVYLPAGKYKIDTYLNSLRSSAYDGSTFKDLNNLTLCGDGDTSILYAEDPSSIFDILQLNQVLNVTIKNLKLYEVATPTDHGANGVSITNGGQNITLDHITVESLPYYVGGGYMDGGKGFTIQWSVTPSLPMRDIIIKDCVVNNSPIGFELDVSTTSAVLTNTIIDGCKFNVNYAGAIVSSISASSNCAVLFTNNIINTSQRGIWISRGKNFVCNNVSIYQTRAITNILPSDTRVAAIEMFSSCEGCHFSNMTIRYTNGVYSIVFNGVGGRTENCTFNHILSMGSFTQAMVDMVASTTPPVILLFNNILNYGSPSSFIQDILTAGSRTDILANNTFNLINKKVMTNLAENYTLGSFASKGIPVYNSLGNLEGYIPLYN